MAALWIIGPEPKEEGRPLDPKLQVHVREYRERLDLTQEELAHKAGVTRNTIHNVERGTTAPNILVALAIAAALGVAVTALFELAKKGGK